MKAVVCASPAGLSAELLFSCWLEFQEMLRDMEAHQPQEPLSVLPSTCSQVISPRGSWDSCWVSALSLSLSLLCLGCT